MSFIPRLFSFYMIFTRILFSVFDVQNYSEVTWLSFNEVVSTFPSLQSHVGLGACSVGVGQLTVGWLFLVNSLVPPTGCLALVGFCFVGHGIKIIAFNHQEKTEAKFTQRSGNIISLGESSCFFFIRNLNENESFVHMPTYVQQICV